ncbi:hypothetical protein GCM10009609_72550 [Pseudonocardia aurantiaca]|uniref:Uncharacterized protein n=1 Tax=Pseudonocardia aurantiaca TaxID=75290 RepID=A0ABW4FIK2_9PSEU
MPTVLRRRARRVDGDPAVAGRFHHVARAAGCCSPRLAHRAPRLARDYERDPALSEAMIRWVAINTMT